LHRIVARLLIIVLVVASMSVMFLPVQGKPRTIIVPDDYLSVTAAIGNAADGDTIFIKKGTYEEPRNQTLMINKTISLVGEDTKGTIVYLHPPLVPYTLFTQTFMVYASPIQIESDNVKLSGLTITSEVGTYGQSVTETQLSATGNQIKIVNDVLNFKVAVTGNGTQIINSTIAGVDLVGSHLVVADNEIHLRGTGQFLISCIGSYNVIDSNNATDVAPVKGMVDGSGGIRVEGFRNIVQNNYVDAQSGIRGSMQMSGDENIVYKNTMHNFVSVGSRLNLVYGNIISSNLETSGHNNTFVGNYFWGILLDSSDSDASNHIFYNNNMDFAANAALPEGEKTFAISSGVHGPIFLDNGTVGNYYSDYNGSDLNNDGIGDIPYVVYANDTSNYHYTSPSDIANIVLTDHYPLIKPFDISTVTLGMPEWATAELLLINRPVVSIGSPESLTYNESSVNLTFTVDKSTSWLGYSLDGNDNVTIAGNTTLTDLSSGLHNITVYAMGENGNVRASETIAFSIAEAKPVAFPTAVAATVFGASIAAVAVGILLYVRKRKQGQPK
jgi:hypothetical protein